MPGEWNGENADKVYPVRCYPSPRSHPLMTTIRPARTNVCNTHSTWVHSMCATLAPWLRMCDKTFQEFSPLKPANNFYHAMVCQG